MVRPRLLLSELGRLLITDDLASPRVAPGPNERQISDPRCARCRAVGIATEMLLTKTEQVSDDAGRHFRFRARQRRACKGGPRAANHAGLSDCCLSIAEQQPASSVFPHTRLSSRLFHKGAVGSAAFNTNFCMPQNFIESRREQGFLLPPARAGLAGAGSLGLSVCARRCEGHGRCGRRSMPVLIGPMVTGLHAYEPSVMVSGDPVCVRDGMCAASRAIERHCREHVAFPVAITGNLVPDRCDGRAASSVAISGRCRGCSRMC